MSRKKHKRRSMRQAIKGGVVRLMRRPSAEPQKPQREGIISPSDVRVPNGLRGGDIEGRGFPLGGLIATILIVGVVWIATVAWLVSQMP